MPEAKSMNLIGRQMQNWADAVWAAFYQNYVIYNISEVRSLLIKCNDDCSRYT